MLFIAYVIKTTQSNNHALNYRTPLDYQTQHGYPDTGAVGISLRHKVNTEGLIAMQSHT